MEAKASLAYGMIEGGMMGLRGLKRWDAWRMLCYRFPFIGAGCMV